MKKLLAVILVVIIIAAAVPFLGNKIIESELKNSIKILTANGIDVSEQQIKSSYLKTSKHYELTIKDADKFSDYLAKYSDSQIPPYVIEMLAGTKLATDIVYCNLPLNNKVSLEIYPLALSTNLVNEIKKENKEFASYAENFLQKGGLKYNLTLDVNTKEFIGYVHDIDETYTTKEGMELKAILKGATYSGKGNIFIPESVDFMMDSLLLNIKDKMENINILLQNIMVQSEFESRSTYKSDVKIDNIVVKTSGGIKGDSVLSLVDVIVNSSSNAKGPKAEVYLKTKFGSLDISSSQNKILLNELVLDTAVKNIDKDAFEKLLDSVNKARTDDSAKMQLEIKKDMENLIARGLDIELPEFSLKNISYEKAKSLKGFNINANFVLPPNVLIPQVKSPLQGLNKIKLDFFLKISKELFTNISSSTPMVAVAKGYAKDSGEDLVYDIKLENGSLTVNGEVIR